MGRLTLTLEQKLQVFGDYKAFQLADGSVGRGWEKQILTTIALPAPLPLSWPPHTPVSTTRVHRLIAPHLTLALEQIYNLPPVWASINDWGGCYCFRPNRKDPKQLSSHCWALGPDMDVLDNPQGHAPHVPDAVRQIMWANGFLWGGLFAGAAVDGMHWEFARLELL